MSVIIQSNMNMRSLLNRIASSPGLSLTDDLNRNIIKMMNSPPRFSIRSVSSMPSWASTNPDTLGKDAVPHVVLNLVNGKWQHTKSGQNISVPDPMDASNTNPIFLVADTKVDELGPFIESMKRVSKSGVHNPLKNVSRYLMYGEISRMAGEELTTPFVADFFAKAIMKCVPKSYGQALGEVKVTAAFLNNFGGDQVRFIATGFNVPGDHDGQASVGYRWPLGPVAIISPFNFPLEIPVLQLMGALFMGNKPVLKPTEKVSFVMEQFLRLLHHCGMPLSDVDFLNCEGLVAEEFVTKAPIKVTQFTGSSRVAEILAERTRGKVRIEDAGFDWKILGPDVSNVNYVAWQCDEDAYATSGQKCSAQSILFAHKNWIDAGILEKIRQNASKRTLDDLTVGPTLTVTTHAILDHIEKLLNIPGAHVLFGGEEIETHNIPKMYGAMKPTAVFVPLDELLKDSHFERCTTEIFAPFQVVTTYDDNCIHKVLEACERMSNHLTAAVVSNDISFQKAILSNTVNGTTYTGLRARTTGAPQNHWFGPCGDVRGCGIGTSEAIKQVWSLHREIIGDSSVPNDWNQPSPS